MAYEITFQDTVEIQKLFSHHNWRVDTTNKSSLYNRYLHTYARLESDERELFISLSYQFKVITLNDYQELLANVISCVIKKYLGKKQTLFIYPIKKCSHKDCIKSSDLVSYLCKSTSLKYNDSISKKKIILLGSTEQVKEKIQQISNNALLIVDDFIGSGKYTSDVIRELALIGIPKDRIIATTLYITQAGIKKLRQEQCQLEYGEIIESFISELSAADKEVLSRIEEKMGVEDGFSFGYGHSGILVSLIRTPNNTAPIFWMPFGRYSAPPFPR